VNISLALSDYIVLLIYLIALLMVGFYLNRRDKKGNADIFLGGRTLRWWQIGFSLFSANAGPMMVVGFAGIGFSHGVVGSNFEWLAWVFILMLAMFFLPRYLTAKISTIPQFLKLRFGMRSYNFLVIYSLISILLVWLGGALYAGGLLISEVFNWSLMGSIAIIVLIAASFTAIGGLKAVIRTGIFQSLIIILSSVILTFLGFRAVGGAGRLAGSVPGNYWKLFRPASDPEYSWIAVILGYPVVAIYYWCADQTIVQKVLAAKDLRNGQYGALFLALLKIIMPFIFIFPGIMCFVLYRNSARPDTAYITLVKQLMPHGLLGLCIAALIAALIDTVSSGLNSFSTVFTLDLAGRWIEMDDTARRRMGRWVTLIAAGLSVGIAYLYSRSGKGFFELSQGLVSILSPPLSVVFLAGIAWKKVSSLAVETVLYGGGLICMGVGICHILNFPYPGFWPHFLLLSVYLFLGLAAVIVIITLISKPAVNIAPSSFGSGGTSSEAGGDSGSNARQVWFRWAILAVIMFFIYLLFN